METNKAHLKQALDLLFHTIDFAYAYNFKDLPEDVQEAYSIAHTALSHDGEWDQKRADELFIKVFGNNELPHENYWEE